MFDVAIIGAGAAAAAAALGLEGKKVVMLDAGFSPDPRVVKPAEGFYEARRASSDLSDYLVGPNFESLSALRGVPVSPKLKSPGMSFITRDWRRYFQVRGDNFQPELSLAKGGFANGWGGGCFEFTSQELQSFPFPEEALGPYYAKLTQELGVCGVVDDLRPFFGSTAGLLPPLDLPPSSGRFLQRYGRNRKALQRKGYFVGRPRLAVLTRQLGERSSYDYNTLDFFQPHQSSVYTPVFTIDRLVQHGALTYLPGLLVKKLVEHEDHVEINTDSLDGGARQSYFARKCVLAAGAIGSANLALSSFGGPGDKLPLRENPTSLMVLFDPTSLGKGQRLRGYGGAQLSLVFQPNTEREAMLASLYDLSPVLRSDVLFDLPLPARSLLAMSRVLVPSFLVLQIFYPDSGVQAGGQLCLQESGELAIRYQSGRRDKSLEYRFARDLLPLGYLTFPPMWKRVVPGQCYHYAGTLPMNYRPDPWECWPDGRLSLARHTYVADAATFPRLPSKNLTFTAMANAWRIAEGLARSLS